MAEIDQPKNFDAGWNVGRVRAITEPLSGVLRGRR
jgi:hypothetical protein